MVHLQERNLPRMVLLDCADDLVTSLEAAGYDLAVGYTGYFAEHPVMDIPAALHEKDLLVVDLDPGWTPRPPDELMPISPGSRAAPPVADHAREPRRQGKPLEAFVQSMARGAVVLCFLEGVTPPYGVSQGVYRGGSFDWLPTPRSSTNVGRAGLSTLEVANDAYLHVPLLLAEQLPELAQLIASPVQAVKSLRTLTGVAPLLLNESEQPKAGLLQPRGGGHLFLLPYFERKPAAMHRLLGSILPDFQADLFPARTTDWSQDDAYQMPQVNDVRQRRVHLRSEHEAALAELEAEEAAAVVAQRSFTDLLSAHGEDLHPVVRDALEWLGFDVNDHDAAQKASSGRLEEDLQVKDGAYFAVVEVTSSRGNAKDKDFMDLEKYRTWRAKDPGRDDVDVTDIRGLLIVNQMHREEPARREPLYASSQDMDWAEHASETGVSVVSTWELFKLMRAVAAGALTMSDARNMLQVPGLFTFTT